MRRMCGTVCFSCGGIIMLSEKNIVNELDTEVFGRKLVVLDEIDSTNNYAKLLAQDGAENGTVVIADYQTAGKGRLGRSFVSPKGTGLYLSLIIRNNISVSSAQLITSCVAVVAAEAIEELCGCDVKIKWVNDLFLGGRKICGILTEASIGFEEAKLDYVIIGIGINVSSLKGKLDSELEKIASSIEDETGEKISRSKLCAVLLKKLEERMNDIESRAFLKEYQRRSMIIGERVVIEERGVSRAGKAIAIADDAGLTIEFENGEIHTINSGEARILKE
ncbi:MAG: biotin--[acetyl-CoA-carboxylase] ligase [Ruminococcus sp.]|nr:biotin--[acetyl-CoA-carboxylase] ligase [Ruminococcus sp.]